ncbi:hypothetical protein EMIHUDRAFT_445835 [Emiliania huxleyi CCMP1516]|uniref:Uncharacterized protein n=2 Tax=Emiliania huxleyi TaxID=2903 RepID=A0A0D3IQ97_EMIH1|nr:hypothetical protein EMIHUDRAFT_445835 [Emiliania huxleyi CCMP1516]EOD13432.1 hypothetical protein EMIHUDRAFT_445835 [Emiliania huxleyi CCMP1516]|eukprot:XP_005765861.1 hypothetical protein EMIHUDRAFT_445835 [Emiliania huxleyi CCMP1516]
MAERRPGEEHVLFGMAGRVDLELASVILEEWLPQAQRWRAQVVSTGERIQVRPAKLKTEIDAAAAASARAADAAAAVAAAAREHAEDDLYQACLNGDVELLSGALARGASPNLMIFNSWAEVPNGPELYEECVSVTYLACACDVSNRERVASPAEAARRGACVRRLLDFGADISHTERNNGAEGGCGRSYTRLDCVHPNNIMYVCVRRKLALCLEYLLSSLPPERRSEWLGLCENAWCCLLTRAIECSSYACLRLLLAAGADPNVKPDRTRPLLQLVAMKDVPEESGESPLAILQLLSSHGASRASVESHSLYTEETGRISLPGDPRVTAERILRLRIQAMEAAQGPPPPALARANAALDWLQTSSEWSTPLHHVALIGATRARKLLRGGADVHASSGDGPSPLSLANDLHAAGHAAAGPLGDQHVCEVARLVRAAAEPWTPQTHELFPDAARAHACDLLWPLARLANDPRLAGGPPQSAFVHAVLSHAITRGRPIA